MHEGFDLVTLSGGSRDLHLLLPQRSLDRLMLTLEKPLVVMIVGEGRHGLQMEFPDVSGIVPYLDSWFANESELLRKDHVPNGGRSTTDIDREVFTDTLRLVLKEHGVKLTRGTKEFSISKRSRFEILCDTGRVDLIELSGEEPRPLRFVFNRDEDLYYALNGAIDGTCRDLAT